jgi:hypothetical protein
MGLAVWSKVTPGVLGAIQWRVVDLRRRYDSYALPHAHEWEAI